MSHLKHIFTEENFKIIVASQLNDPRKPEPKSVEIEHFEVRHYIADDDEEDWKELYHVKFDYQFDYEEKCEDGSMNSFSHFFWAFTDDYVDLEGEPTGEKQDTIYIATGDSPDIDSNSWDYQWWSEFQHIRKLY